MLGAVAVCAGVAVIRHFKNRKPKNHQTKSPQAPTSKTSSPAKPAATSAIDDKIPSPRSPVASSTHVSPTAPFRLDAAVRSPSVANSNGQLAIFEPPAAPEAAPAAIAFVPDLIPSTTPIEDAENSLNHDESEGNGDLPKLQHHHRASKALADMSNRGAGGGSLTTRKRVRVPPLDLSRMVQKGT
ncbi:hypothetical protein ABBQ32_007566 [Trebouxia sp. C0010 RCD-2024]